MSRFWKIVLLVIAVLLVVNRQGLAAADMWDMSSIALWMMVGSLLHILEDALCGKVPLLRLSRKIGIKLFTVGSFTEYFFSIAVVLLCYIFKVSR